MILVDYCCPGDGKDGEDGKASRRAQVQSLKMCREEESVDSCHNLIFLDTRLRGTCSAPLANSGATDTASATPESDIYRDLP